MVKCIPPFDEENFALKSLVTHKNKLAWVKQRCSSLWDLWFLADPKSGGYAYFSGAIASGFSMMLIDDENNKIHGPEKTEVWKSQFDPSTGWINNKFNAYSGLWYFCKLI